MKLLVVIVNYKVTDLTVDCLVSLAPEIAAQPGTHVALCENGTGPEAVQQFRAAIEQNGWFDWVTLTAIHPNRGFTGGNNVILREALARADAPPYFLLLNADTIVRPGALRALVDFMDNHPQAGIAGSRLESLEGVPRSTAFRFFSIASELDHGLRLGIVSRLLRRWQTTGPLPVVPTPSDWTSGAALLVRREVFEQVGLLDEDLYTYFDDIDLCLRARRAGWLTWLVPDSRVVHLTGRSTGVAVSDERQQRRPAYWFQARRRFWLKNHGPWRTLMADTAWITGFALWRLRRLIQRKPDSDPPMMLVDSIRHSVFLTGFKLQPVRNPALG
ncbi:MAG: glycosyltransferase family 2 protein [Planctomycetes bacterium]|nr:glycosyltransferase family 2 protein [Planctomycetota bacterium]